VQEESGPDRKNNRRTRGWRELMRRLRPYTRPQRRYAVVIALCLLLGLPLAWLYPILIKKVFDVAVPAHDLSLIIRLGIFLAAVAWLEAILAMVRGFCTTLFQSKVLHRLRLDIFRAYQSVGLGFVRKRETGEMMARLSEDVGNLGGVMADQLVLAVNAVVEVLVVGAILVVLEWRLAAIAAVGGALVILVNLPFSKALRRRSHEVQEKSQDLRVEEHQALTGQDLIRASASEPFELRRYGAALGAAIRANVRRDIFGLWTGHPSVVLRGISSGVVLLAGAALIADGSITQGDLFAIFIFLGQFFSSAATLARMNPAFQASLASLDRITDLLDAEKSERQPTGPRVLEEVRGAVRFCDVRFGYGREGDPGVREVLRGISFFAPAGTRVAVVGRSGAGKTTLLSMIPRFFEPWSGRVEIDGIDLAGIEVRSLRRHVGIVPQDVFLFDRTVAENLAYGSPDATRAQIEEAAAAAAALDFIRALPAGLDTRIGERGVKLSTGQRQRLAIAREILRNPAILILDEATSALDSNTESEVQAAFDRLLAGRTSFTIAHRLSTVRRADVILFLDDGRLAASGTYEELIRDCPAFRELVLLQSVAFEPIVRPIG
jgi:ABC-type multidrug transport system fused ATPase/permease subunit